MQMGHVRMYIGIGLSFGRKVRVDGERGSKSGSLDDESSSNGSGLSAMMDRVAADPEGMRKNCVESQHATPISIPDSESIVEIISQ